MVKAGKDAVNVAYLPIGDQMHPPIVQPVIEDTV
jgi:hypothetical protein